MLPGPGRFLLITLETIERNRQQPLSAGGAQPCVDFVKRARSCLHRHGIADPLHQPIIILRGPQRPASVGLSCKIAAEQIDEIQVGGMGERSATKPAQRSEEHTSELKSLMRISYAVFCLKKKNKK